VAQRRIEAGHGQVVRLLTGAETGDGVPAVLPVPARMTVAGRVAVGIVLVAASATGLAAIVLLWTEDTPGWWFSALFTVFISLLLVALWLGYGFSIRAARRERVLAGQWSAALPGVSASPGRIARRHLGFSEDGDVTQLELTVSLPDGTMLAAQWYTRQGTPKLMPDRVPEVGAAVRVWRMPVPSPDAPLVVDAVLNAAAAPENGAGRGS